MSYGTPVYSGNRIVGRVVGESFVKRAYASRHFLRKPPAIASDTDALERARQLGAKKVIVEDKESGKVYSAAIELVFEKGFRLDRGYNEQIALPLDKWVVE